ncbi:MAG: glycosyltransferase [Gemmatimonadota bacterium]|nr:glycosyltransferase [Gemmatimonadota bacterium]
MASLELSVVIPSVNGWHDLRGCLEAVEAMRDRVSLETIVVDRLGGELRDQVRRTFPAVRFIPVDAGTTIPMMRHRAFQETGAPVVAVIEDHVIVPPAWGRQLLDALAQGHEVVGGPIVNAATDRLLDWATFLCEYSACLPPLPAGPSAWLPGNNVGYRRELLVRYRDVTAEGKWENRLHDAMREDGVVLECRPDIVVGHKKHFGFGEYLSQRYLYSRSYAGARVRGAPLPKRLVMGAAAVLLPPVLLLRIMRSLAAKQVAGGLRLRTFPLIGLFVVSWGIGEVVGYWFGDGGALAKVR